MAATPTTPHPIPFIYRLAFNYLEPILASGGTLQVLLAPTTYTPISHPTLHAALTLHPQLLAPLQTLFTCVAGGWAMLAFNDLVTLRVCGRQPEVWRCVMMAHLVSDLFYLVALMQDLGVAHFWDPRVWSGEEWFTNVLTLPFTVLKVALILGVGLGDGDGKVDGKGKRA